jgi:protein-L-isoaspartate O-methyltransferase
MSSSYTATYSPEDNKLRLYSVSRLPADVYARIKAAGFSWAPKQELFVAPMWTPGREDILLDLCGEIGDEDTSLAERAEQRADRFEEYSDRRASDAESARKAVSAIADHIPLGQPILVGHHSEKHARRDAEKIENGMRRAVKMWETSKYWTDRAAGAIRNAKYKERPDVRARRIKGLESDERKQAKHVEQSQRFIAEWSSAAHELTRERAMSIANLDHISRCFPLAEYPRTPPASQYEGAMSLWSAMDGGVITAEQAREIALRVHRRSIAYSQRWLAHLANRLSYERAMLEADGGIPAAKWDLQPGGRVLCRGEWATIMKVNRRGGQVTSVTTNARYVSKRNVEEINDYQPPAEGVAEKVTAAMKLPPMCNYPGADFVHMTRADWERRQFSDSPKSHLIKATEQHGAHRVRATPSRRVSWQSDCVYLTDEKRKDPPAPKPTSSGPVVPPPERALEPAPAPRPAPEPTAYDAMRKSLRAGGVQVVSAPQLFPTPPELADSMVELAELQPEHLILEPSGGTARIILAIRKRIKDAEIVAVEIKSHLAEILRSAYRVPTHCRDFLQCNGELGTFDRVLMNPPFENAADIKHIEHALTMLKPGGRLVAICANGPRQQERLQPMATIWKDLPPGTFKAEGTGVNTALLVIDKE